MPSKSNPRQRVCMFVYNTMAHDARVRKEARTLAEAGYDVTVLCVLAPGVTPREEIVRGFRIFRLSREILGVSSRELGARFVRRPTAQAARTDSPALPAPRPRSGLLARLLVRVDSATKMARYPLRRILVFFRFVGAAVRTGADVYHAHDVNTLLMAWAASRLRRKPLIYDTHEVATDRAGLKLRWWASLLERSLIHRADQVICTNKTRADFTQRRYRIPPPTILRNLPAYVEPRPSKLVHERLGIPPETKIVLYQGGVQPERGLEQLMAATPQIKGGVVVMLGNGRLKPSLQRMARDLGVEDKVLFHDAVPVDELPEWTADAYVGLQILQNTCFNHYSALSNKLLEYLMAGVPVIASDLPEMRQVIEDSGAGLLIDASDPAEIAAAANRLLADGKLREEMAEKALRARRRYSWEVEEHVLVALYAGLASNG